MSLLKKSLSSLISSIAGDSVNEKVSKFLADDEDEEKSIVKEENEEEYDDEDDDEFDDEEDEKVTAVKGRNILSTPLPPPVPTPTPQSLSVMIAVNGQSYGPYERATLLNMIADGSLTKDTYVFIDGMANWQTAGTVPQVNSLFTVNSPTQALPPIPWATAPKGVSASDSYSNSPFSSRLDSLITSAIADGEITDLERQVLIRNAQKEGVDMDEFVMVLEARLYEQRKSLIAQEDAKKQADREMQLRQSQMMRASQNSFAQPSQPRLTKCPHCGTPIKVLV